MRTTSQTLCPAYQYAGFANFLRQQASGNVSLVKMIGCEWFPSGLNMTHYDIVLVALLSHSSSPASALAGLVSYAAHYDTEA